MKGKEGKKKEGGWPGTCARPEQGKENRGRKRRRRVRLRFLLAKGKKRKKEKENMGFGCCDWHVGKEGGRRRKRRRERPLSKER